MAAPLRLGVVAGEPSGDLLGARLLGALRERCPALVAEGVGGPLMRAEGLSSLYPMERLSVMGLVEPLGRLPELLRLRARLFRHFRAHPPDVFLGIDSPDFNLPLARRLRESGLKTAHLVSPSVWAWRAGRVARIGRAVDMLLCLFPFEPAIYAARGIPARFVGHPLARELAAVPGRSEARAALGLAPAGPLLALLPGSRPAEVRRLAPVFLDAAARLARADPDLRFVLPVAGEPCRRFLPRRDDLPLTLLDGHARTALAASDVVLVASGTATLEAALLQRPMVVAYRMGALSWHLLSRLLRTEHVALPNILAGRRLVPELLQDRATPDALARAVAPLLCPDGAAPDLLEAFAAMRAALSRDFGAEAAAALLELSAGPGGDGLITPGEEE